MRKITYIKSNGEVIEKKFDYKTELESVDLRDYKGCGLPDSLRIWKHVKFSSLSYYKTLKNMFHLNHLGSVLTFGKKELSILSKESEASNACIDSFTCILILIKKSFPSVNESHRESASFRASESIVTWGWNVKPKSYLEPFGEMKDIEKLKPEQFKFLSHPDGACNGSFDLIHPKKIYSPLKNAIIKNEIIAFEAMKLCVDLDLIYIEIISTEYTLGFGIKLKSEEKWKEFKRNADTEYLNIFADDLLK